jgi:hypothetical protein
MTSGLNRPITVFLMPVLKSRSLFDRDVLDTAIGMMEQVAFGRPVADRRA